MANSGIHPETQDRRRPFSIASLLDDPARDASPKRQKALGSSPDKEKKQRCHDDYTVGWICALSLELGAAKGMLDEEHSILPCPGEDTNTYTLGRIGHHNVVLACLPSYGISKAAAVGSNMRRSFPKIQIGLMVGIGGGVPSECSGRGPDIRLGDVVVGDLVIQYDLGKMTHNGRFERSSLGQPPPDKLATAVKSLRGHHASKPSQIPNLLSLMFERYPIMALSYQRPSIDNTPDRVFDAQYEHPELSSAPTCKDCDQSRLLQRSPRNNNDPAIHYGTIASGNRVIKHATTRDDLVKDLGAICFEMEASGLVDASFPCLAIRGISDYADSHKNKQWQNYAAATAAAYAKELLSIIPGSQGGGGMTQKVSSLHKYHRNFLDALRFTEINSRQATIQSALARTCEWLLDHDYYRDWLGLDRYKEHHGFLWICGKPGAGKSTLMKFAHLQMSRQYNTDTDIDAITIAFFFNARGADIEKSPIGMYRSLIVQLLQNRPNLHSALDHQLRILLNVHGPDNIRFDCVNEIEVLREILARVVERLGNIRLTCFIDALDECDDHLVQDMVDDFEALVERAVENSVQLHICFSSRHYPHITIQYGQRMILENQTGHINDLQKYVKSKLKAGSSERAKDLQDEILRKADGVFLWVFLVVDILNKEFKNGRIFDMQKRLKELPKKLGELFRDILLRDNDNIEDLRLCIQWVLFSQWPLQRQEFYYALVSGLSPESLGEWDSNDLTVQDMDRFALSSSKGLVEIITSDEYPTVQFIHESVRDFFLKENGFQQLWPEFENDFESHSHEQLKNCCYSYIVNISDSFFARFREIEWIFEQEYTTKYPFLTYAIKYLLRHAEAAAATISQRQFLHIFDRHLWAKLHRLTDPFNTYSKTGNCDIRESLTLIILVLENLPRLIRMMPQEQLTASLIKMGESNPLAIALAKHRYDAAAALLHPMEKKIALQIYIFQNYTHKSLDINSQVFTPLIWADRIGHIDLVRLILNAIDMGIDSKDDLGIAPISQSSKSRQEAVVKLLSGRSTHDSGDNYNIQEALVIAAKHRHVSIVRMLLKIKEVDVNYIHAYNGTPLVVAVREGRQDIVQLLLETGRVDLNITNRCGVSSALLRFEHLHIAQLSVMTSIDGFSALSMAAANGSLEIVNLLLQHGADAKVRDFIGRTALSYAAEFGHEKIVDRLWEVDINGIYSKDHDGRTPIWWAAKRGHKIITKKLLGTRMVRIEDHIDKYGESPLCISNS